MSRNSERHATANEEYEAATWNAPRLLAVITLITAAVAMTQGLWGWPVPIEQETRASSIALTGALLEGTASTPQAQDEPGGRAGQGGGNEPRAIPSATPSAPQVGIVAGHLGADSGAICPDGKKEVDINLAIAQQVEQLLTAQGYRVDLLQEFDSRLSGYYANALVSIHADSCEPILDATPPATGYKVASVEHSAVPEEEAALVACLAQAYKNRTGMYYHANSITDDMTQYHTFYEIDPLTPAAIIETGFMYSDRQMLTDHSDLVAQGIVEGIICFLAGDDEAAQ